MTIKIAITTLLILLLFVILPSVNRCSSGHDPRDLSYWTQAGATRNWASAAGRGDPQAQFFHGIGFIRTNLVTMIDRVPGLSSIPVVGKRFFESTSYSLDNRIHQEQLAEAYQWIKQSADQGFAPAKEAEKLFRGRIAGPNPGGPPNPSNSVVH